MREGVQAFLENGHRHFPEKVSQDMLVPVSLG